ncbi:MAG TPA: ankyrin repeat domain-containing protein [Sedimentisphaerales bacterium]|nr:ankyrin repeat domain-containing protein [Sedimentisphaerales bacterium]
MEKHDEIKELLVPFVFDSVSERQESELMSHLDLCAECRDEVKRLERLSECTKRMGNLSGDDDMLQSAKAAVLAAAEDEEGVTAEQTINIRNLWRIIIESRITKLAAAAVIIAAFLFLVYLGNGSIDIAAPAFAQVIDNFKQAKWIYFFKEDIKEGTIEYEVWACPDSQILFGRRANEGIIKLDCRANRKYEYNAKQDTVTISYAGENFAKEYRKLVFSPLNLLDEIISRSAKEDAYITQQKARYNGTDALLYKFTVPLPRGPRSDITEESQWVVDARTHLPIVNDIAQISSDGMVYVSHRYAFDYPETGPEDVFELGAPRTADVIDETPSEEVERILRTYEQIRRSTLPRYMAVIKENDRPRCIEYYNGNSIRVEHFELAINYSDWEPKKELYQQQMGDTFDSVFGWMTSTDTMRRTSIVLNDGIFEYRDSEKTRLLTENSQLRRLGWWEISFASKIVENDYSKENGLICLQYQQGRSYIDPNRDYICVRREDLKGQISLDVVEFGQTTQGYWYPKMVKTAWWNERLGRGFDTNRVYLVGDPEFPPDLFDPKALPGYVEMKSEEAPIHKPTVDSNEIPEYQGFTPLHMAVFSGSADSVRELLSDGAEVNTTVNPGATPMELAALRGQLEIVRLLHEHGGRFTSGGDQSRSALAAAVQAKHHDIAAYMLEHGADINGRYKEGNVALHYAAAQGQAEMTELLLKYGADVHIRNNGGYMPLHKLAERSRFSKLKKQTEDIKFARTARLLIDAGADVNAVARDEGTPLLIALSGPEGWGPDVGLIRELANSGTDLNTQTSQSRGTPLANAVRLKDLEVVEILLEAGADPFVEGGEEPHRPTLPVDIAAMNGYEDIEKLLRKYMEPKVFETNNQIKIVVTQFFQAVRNEDYDALYSVVVDHPHYSQGIWKSWAKTIHNEYSGHYELFDEILGMKFQSSWAETIINRPESDKEKYLVLTLMQYPDGSWKIISRTSSSFNLEARLKNIPAYSLRRSLKGYREKIFGIDQE